MSKKYKNPNQLRAYLAMTWYVFRAQTRNRATFAFGFLFPVVFISIFGLIGNSNQKVTIGIPDDSQNTFIAKTLQQIKFVKVQIGDKTELENKLRQGKLGGVVIVEQTQDRQIHFNVKVETSSASPQESGSINALMQGIVDKAVIDASGITNPPVTIEHAVVSGRESRYIDFALPGQIGFSLLSTAIFGTVFGLIFLKKALVLKRMFATPTKPMTILLAQGTSRLIMAMLQTLLILGLGVFIFKFYLPHGLITFAEIMILCAFGLIAFLGFGYFMAGLANDENSAGPLVNLVTLPQFLLAGTFFPTDSLPNWIQPIANNLPLSYFNLAIRKITTEGGNLSDTWPYLLGLTAWGAFMYILAARTFKWE